jgi:tetratricopeptide (TPR) repeat protein
MRLALVALLAIGTSQAWAQSKKYPPPAPDKELEDEKRSDLWESTLNPDTRPYKELVREAKRLIERNTAADMQLALEKLDAAIKRVPKDPEAYLVRGQLFLAQKEWVKCADDLGRAEDYSKNDEPAVRTRARIDLASCLARAGRYAEAETTLVRAGASAHTYRNELWMRLGEVRIALGKLDEAIDALTAAVDVDGQNAMTRWLLTAAYDRARRPSEALEHAQIAARFDPNRDKIERPTLPLLGVDEVDYLDGLAYRYATPNPEKALVYFRRYVKLAPDSLWKRRAAEHVRDLSAMKFPSREAIASNGAPIVVEEMRSLLERPVAAMRQCLVKLPMSAYQITITKHGPRTPETVRDRPIYRLPPAGVKVSEDQLAAGEPQAETDAAKRCLEQHAEKLKLPAPKDRDTYYQMSFIVVSP